MGLLSRGPKPVTFLMYNADGGGGLARVVVAVMNQIVEHRPVRLISMVRHKEHPPFPLDPRIDHTVLLDHHRGVRRWNRVGEGEPTQMVPRPAEQNMSRMTDRALQKGLKRLGDGVVVSTRPSLHLAHHLWGDQRARMIAWDHKNYETRFENPRMASVMRTSLPAMRAFVVLTEADAADYARDLGDRLPPTHVIRNPLSWPKAETPAPLTAKRVVAAGRLTDYKGFDRMIDAYAALAHDFPDWRLTIWGHGSLGGDLRQQVRDRGMEDFISMPGFTDDLKSELRDAAIYAMTSRAEGFPMVLLEAMAEGLPLVSMDCPRGPAEIIRDGENGLLTPDGDVPAFTEALRRMMGDEEFRRSTAAAAYTDADQYTMDAIVQQWLELFERVEAS